MKKEFIATIVMLIIFGIVTIVAAGELVCKEPIMKKKVMQDIVNQWFIDKEAENFAFTQKMAATVRNMAIDAKNVSDFLALGIYETILYEHYTDEITCAVDGRKAIKMEQERDAIHSTFGNKARTFFRRLPSVAKDEKGKQQLENFSGCYFQDIEPTLQKMYKNHPARRSCAK